MEEIRERPETLTFFFFSSFGSISAGVMCACFAPNTLRAFGEAGRVGTGLTRGRPAAEGIVGVDEGGRAGSEPEGGLMVGVERKVMSTGVAARAGRRSDGRRENDRGRTSGEPRLVGGTEAL